MRTRSRTIAAVSVLCLVAGAGCSWVGMRRPPERPIAADQPIRCTAAPAAPLVDAVLAVPALAGGVTLLANGGAGHCGYSGPCLTTAEVGLGVILVLAGGMYAASALHGFQSANQCSEVLDSQRDCLGGNVAACRKLQASPAPDPVPPSRSPWLGEPY